MKKFCFFISGALAVLLLLPYIVFEQPELPEGTNFKGSPQTFTQARLLVDRTAWDEVDQTHIRSHRIFDTILAEIKSAETAIIVDFFLWNPWKGLTAGSEELRPLADELADALIAKHKAKPNMPILVLTDPINRIYGAHISEHLSRLKEAGIPLVFTDLKQLPDSNRVFAPHARFWSGLFTSEDSARIEGSDTGRFIANPFDPEGAALSFGELTRLLYFKANHRKILVTGRAKGQWRLLIGSLNPADGSANHSNLAVLLDGAVAIDAAQSEIAIAKWSLESRFNADHRNESKEMIRRLEIALEGLPDTESNIPSPIDVFETVASFRSEGAIRQEIIEQLDYAAAGSRIDAAVFYLSDRGVVLAMKRAVERGASLRLLLDANRDAFGREKNGVPNRPVAAELMKVATESEIKGSIEIRWASTHGEQFHAKVLRVVGESQDILLLGSANWTRRNLDNLNLEANVLFEKAGLIGDEFDAYFDSIWHNRSEAGFKETLSYETWEESGWALRWKSWLYRFQEWSGASTF